MVDQATALQARWTDFAPLLLDPGSAGNTTYLDEAEAQRAIYTQILSALEFTKDTRLGRPLGEVARARPTRAEAWRSGRSLTQSVLATEAAVGWLRLWPTGNSPKPVRRSTPFASRPKPSPTRLFRTSAIS